jgi:hypothetical protein
VLGAASALASPHWLGHDRLIEKRLVARDLIWPDGRPSRAAAVSLQETTVPAAPAGALPQVVRGDRRSFRVLDGGRKED